MLSVNGNENTANWYIIHTHSKQENRVMSNLNVLNVQSLCPRIRERRFQQYASALTYTIKPLFTGYLFAKFILEDLYHKIRFTRGVYNIVSFGGKPAPISEEIINVILVNIDDDGYVRIDEGVRPGDRVVVKDGPLKNFVGIFEREMKDVERIRILLETVSYQAHVEIEKGMVKKAK